MAAFTSKATGDWDAEGATTWNEAGHPTGADTVTVQNTHTVTLDSATACTTLTIDAGGEVTDATNNVGLTVSGDTDIAGTLTCGTAAVSLGSGATGATYTVVLNSTGTLDGGSGANTFGNARIAAGSQWTATSGTTTLDGRQAGGAILNFVNTSTFTHSNGLVHITMTAGAALLEFRGENAGGVGGPTFYDLNIDTTNREVKVYNGSGDSGSAALVTVANDMTITTGSYTCYTTGQAVNPLTVTGDCNITGTLNGVAAAISLGSLVINSGGTYSATSGTTTITSEEAGGYAVWAKSGSTLTANNGLLVLNTGEASHFRTNSSGNFYNIQINASCTATHVTTLTIDNDLTIDASAGFASSNPGSNYIVTVTGDVSVSGDWTETGSSGAMTMGSLTIASGGTYAATSGVTTIPKRVSGAYALIIAAGGTLTHNDGTFTFDNTVGRQDITTAGNSFYNVIIGGTQSRTYRWIDALTIDNDLTINRTAADGLYPGPSLLAITVTGDVTVANLGYFRGLSSTVSHGSLTINGGGTYSATSGTTTLTSEDAGNYTLNNDGTFTHNNGTVLVTNNDSSWIDTLGPGAGNLYNLTISNTAGSVTQASTLTIDNDLTITASPAGYDLGTFVCTVTGDVATSGMLYHGAGAQTCNFGSLTINSGGTYSATTGTTSLTAEHASGWIWKNEGTFTHNNGKVDIADNLTGGSTSLTTGGDPFYDLEISTTSDTVYQADACTVANDFTLEAGEGWNTSSSDYAFTVTGATSISGTLACNSSAVDMDGNVTINIGGSFSAPDGSGSLNIDGSTIFADNTFVHNDGTVTFDISGTKGLNGLTTYYDVVLDATSITNELQIANNTTIENSLSITTGEFRPNGGVTITLGTGSTAATFVNNSRVQPRSNTVSAVIITAASASYPVACSGTDWDWDATASGLVTITDLAYNIAATTGGGGVTITATNIDFSTTLVVSTGDTFLGTDCAVDDTGVTADGAIFIDAWHASTVPTTNPATILIGGTHHFTANAQYLEHDFEQVGTVAAIVDVGVHVSFIDCTKDSLSDVIDEVGDIVATNNGLVTVYYGPQNGYTAPITMTLTTLDINVAVERGT